MVCLLILKYKEKKVPHVKTNPLRDIQKYGLLRFLQRTYDKIDTVVGHYYKHSCFVIGPCSSSHFLPTYRTLSHVIWIVLWFHLIWRYIMTSVVIRRTRNLEVGCLSPTSDIRYLVKSF
uniref:Uncharacterized protein n=1 Tax=Cacopsylla melanoneura TaxID=428564 RepID=A0A8D8VE26_9HEMI